MSPEEIIRLRLTKDILDRNVAGVACNAAHARLIACEIIEMLSGDPDLAVVLEAWVTDGNVDEYEDVLNKWMEEPT